MRYSLNSTSIVAGVLDPSAASTPDSKNSSSFIYSVMDNSKTSIRLLHLSRANSKSRQTDWELEEFDLSRCPPFAALSYEWGSPESIVQIVINGKLFKLRQNLDNALNFILRRMKWTPNLVDEYDYYMDNKYTPHSYPYRWEHWEGAVCHRFSQQPEDWKYFWIDAICINQHDEHEKSDQVRLMSKIYQSAAFVLVWLGDATSQARFAIDTIVNRWLYGDLSFHYDALRHLFQLSYWKRLWIVQEFVHANDVLIACGDSTMSWNDLEAFHLSYALRPRLWKLPSTELITYKRKSQNIKARTRLSDVLERFVHQCCSDPRDKVYGLLSLAAEPDRFVEELGIKVDYSKTALDVYTEVLMALRRDPVLDRPKFEMLQNLLREEIGIDEKIACRILADIEKRFPWPGRVRIDERLLTEHLVSFDHMNLRRDIL